MFKEHMLPVASMVKYNCQKLMVLGQTDRQKGGK